MIAYHLYDLTPAAIALIHIENLTDYQNRFIRLTRDRLGAELFVNRQ